ncbi:MAG: ATP-binding cassette domain-containing protein [Saccharolobus sp.]
MIEVNVKKRIQDFSLAVNFSDEGIICITGKNGSGKSTLLNIIAGVIKPDYGYIKLNKTDITNLPIRERNIVLVTPDSYIPTFSVKKHLKWGASLRRKKINEEEIREIIKLLELTDYEDKKVGSLSLGNKEKVALATAILAKPELILVDEAFGNINQKEHFVSNYKELCKKYNIELVYATQDVELVKLSDHHYTMSNGSLSKVF